MIKSPQLSLFFKWWFAGKGLNQTSDSADSMTGIEFVMVASITLAILFLLYYFITKLFEKKSGLVNLKEPLPKHAQKILVEKSAYYGKLKNTDKDRFERRVRFYMASKMFTAEEGYAVTEEMKVCIAAAATQITFGLPAFLNSNYSHISIIPDANTIPKANSNQSIVIPWKEFSEGNALANDGKHDGLKILATALIKDNQLQDKSYKILPTKKLAEWYKVAIAEEREFMSGMFQGMENDERIRNEYFAMAIVYFFELPIAFKQKYPTLFNAMVNLLGQDTVKNTVKK